ncbi:plasmid encoded RepA protein (plasmid) [Thalassoporum mexicanum PCC 7367]|uniref:replication protein RepA n=1 Tax=Thalassoporum mexicanum TaxID=3457544 RepID=UPI00029FDCF6|nr:replication protein RepA [Pseudanabaena sp. PCC 7367]AFY71915.1 plasmid encoded RepA protein [Pseudanabaena sp. PCC 7367]
MSIKPSHLRLLDAAAAVQSTPEVPENEKAFLTRQLVQVTLPYRDPGDVPAWSRSNGDLTLGIRPGWDFTTNTLIGYPYGSIPRLLLFWINTEVLRTKQRTLKLGDSCNDFLRKVGLSPNTGGGKRSDRKRLINQMERLFRAKISFDYRHSNPLAEGKSWVNMDIADSGDIWWNPKQPDQQTLFDSKIELGEKFYEAILAAPIPLDLRILKAIKRSPLALDLYAWATYKTYIASQKKKEQYIPWPALQMQLGGDFGNSRQFKVEIKNSLHKVQTVYPALQFNEVIENNTSKGLVIVPSTPSVRPNPAKR